MLCKALSLQIKSYRVYPDLTHRSSPKEPILCRASGSINCIETLPEHIANIDCVNSFSFRKYIWLTTLLSQNIPTQQDSFQGHKDDLGEAKQWLDKCVRPRKRRKLEKEALSDWWDRGQYSGFQN